jgi:hypothetical protein
MVVLNIVFGPGGPCWTSFLRCEKIFKRRAAVFIYMRAHIQKYMIYS